MVFQAFIDESMDQRGVFVLGGCIADDEAWAAFSKEWAELLAKFNVLDKKNRKPIFKMKDMAFMDREMEIVSQFYRVIEKHVLGFISCKIDNQELKRAKSLIYIPDAIIDWHKFDAYMVAYRFLMDKFHIARPEMVEAIPAQEKVDFYFDERPEKKTIKSFWNEYILGRPKETRDYYGSMPVFVNDDSCLPIQAADFWVWWVRRWYLEGSSDKIRTRDFGPFKKSGDRKILTMDIVIDEEALVQTILKIARRVAGPNRPIYDTKLL